MTRFFSHSSILLAALCTLTNYSHGMDYMNTHLPQELRYIIILHCTSTPASLNALRKACKPLWRIANKNNIPRLLANPTSYVVTKDEKGNTVTKCLLKLTFNDLHDTVQAADSAKDQTTLDSLKTYFSDNPNMDILNACVLFYLQHRQLIKLFYETQ